jgi:2,3-bisphosphoglycerate-independent phosphoglycerate mutase
MERPALDEWMKRSEEVLAEAEEAAKRIQQGKKIAELVLPKPEEDGPS